MTALAAGRPRARADPLAELDHRDEAVAVIAVPTLRARLLLGTERGERAIAAFGKWHRQAGRTIAVGRIDCRRDALDPVDLAPGHLPASEIGVQASDCGLERAKLLVGRRVARQAHHRLVARLGFWSVQLLLER